MKAIYSIFVVLFAALLIAGCGGSSSMTSTDEGDIPDWFLDTPQDDNYIFAANTATSRDMQLAIDKASADARAEIGRQMEAKVEGIQKNFSEEVGEGENATLLQQMTQATKTIVSTQLAGSSIAKKEVLQDGDNWRAYVLMQQPIGAAANAFMQSLQNNEEMYTRFRSSQAFDELEKSVEEYEKWKQEQKNFD